MTERGGVASQASAEVNDRALPGHWEGGLPAGAANTHIATLAKRHSRLVALVRVEGKDTQSVHGALTRQIGARPVQTAGP